MGEKNRIYVAIDLKSFYASVECMERGLDPLSTNLVVADASRTEKTICLAVSPTLKVFGLSGRSRLFEVVQKVKNENALRIQKAPQMKFSGKSYDANELNQDPSLAIDYIAATPRMALYMDYSARIFQVYMKYIAPEDVHVYSIDEVFMDVTDYLKAAGQTAREFTKKMIQDVYDTVGITATAGIGTNLYLCKIAMDIMAKHTPADEDGVRIAELNEYSYRKELWAHQPITDFWRIGRGYAKKLAEHGMFTMGDVARCSIGTNKFQNEDLLYKIFGINAELLIDHAWGYEPCTIEDVKAYRPEVKSTGAGQVLQSAYTFEKARVIVQEMTELLVLDLVAKGVVTDQIVLTIGYDILNLTIPEIRDAYQGEIVTDMYGRKTPKHAHGTTNFKIKTSSTRQIMNQVMNLFDQIVNPDLLVRRVNLSANRLEDVSHLQKESTYEQLDLFSMFTDPQMEIKEKESEKKEKQIQQAMLDIKKKYGKNAILKGTNLKDGAMTIERNQQIGGHKA